MYLSVIQGTESVWERLGKKRLNNFQHKCKSPPHQLFQPSQFRIQVKTSQSLRNTCKTSLENP